MSLLIMFCGSNWGINFKNLFVCYLLFERWSYVTVKNGAFGEQMHSLPWFSGSKDESKSEKGYQIGCVL